MWFKTAFQGYSLKFSPFEDGRIAVATAQNFGIIGNGKQYVLQASACFWNVTAASCCRRCQCCTSSNFKSRAAVSLCGFGAVRVSEAKSS